MHGIKEAVPSPINGTTAVGLGNRSVLAEGWRELATVDPLTVAADLEKVFVIPEFTATHDPVQLLRSPMGLGIGSIGGVAWTNRRKGIARMVDKASNVLRSHSREEPRGRGLNISSLRCRCLESIRQRVRRQRNQLDGRQDRTNQLIDG